MVSRCSSHERRTPLPSQRTAAVDDARIEQRRRSAGAAGRGGSAFGGGLLGGGAFSGHGVSLGEALYER